MSELSIRKATEADLPVLLALYGQPSFNNGRVVTLDEARAIFARMALYPDFAAYLAEIEGVVVGTFALMVIDNIAHWGTPTALVENVVVAEGRQGGGIGRAMMRAAFQIAEAKGAYKVALSSGMRNEKAHAFYESLGFEKYGFSFRLDPPPAAQSAEPGLAVDLIEERA
ncbi:GNAT family N-acetyltransferase [Kaistia dalseonensis]|uniref:GNAT superfamily N-acetyltransferase n=1 Tax=Kaistia dalseonensis TaxID=410840 RepID=A0ABU0H9D0_9HYPH|nr:GNAT family N-acetyltransferase [Kaistia dalseonensis]MCX5495994.1 GNAT family N-acetyltransferase [Kaistia dalseonensis]MDQ0438597.1 GNAT superfamily N-acetyltransferase [Kaistia dalseonensis]